MYHTDRFVKSYLPLIIIKSPKLRGAVKVSLVLAQSCFGHKHFHNASKCGLWNEVLTADVWTPLPVGFLLSKIQTQTAVDKHRALCGSLWQSSCSCRPFWDCRVYSIVIRVGKNIKNTVTLALACVLQIQLQQELLFYTAGLEIRSCLR